MSTEYRMPSLGAGMTEGTVLEWHVGPGDRVRRGDVVGVVDTDKGAIDMEIFEDGEVVEVLAPPGTKAPVGEPLLSLRPREEEAAAPTASPEADGKRPEAEPEEAPPAAEEPPADAAPERAPSREPTPPPEPAPPREPHAVPEAGHPGERRVRASPAARRRAEELEVDLSSVAGSGPDGAVTLQDVEEVAAGRGPAEPEPVPLEGEEAPGRRPRPRITPVAREAAEALGVEVDTLEGTGPGGAVTRSDVERAAARRGVREEPARENGERTDRREEVRPDADRKAAMRRAVAAAMARSKREIPHYYLSTTLSMEAALRWLEAANRGRSPQERILPVALHLKALARTLGEYPELNGFWENGAFRPAEDVHVGLAVSLRGGGLVAPAIHRVAERSLDELTAAVRDVVFRARAGKLRISEMSDPTVTLTSLGDRGVETVFGVIHPPQVSIIGVGTVVERPWARDGMVGSHRVVTVTLSADHRVSDGHRGGLFLDRLAQRLQQPEEM